MPETKYTSYAELADTTLRRITENTDNWTAFLSSCANLYVYDYFKNKQHSVSFEQPSIDAYKLYYHSIKEVLTNTFGTSVGLSGDLCFGNAPLSVLVLNIGRQSDKGLNVITSNDRLNEILSSLDSSLVDNKQMVFVRRNLRIYQQDKIYIVKPSQRKYWTYSAACRDADEIFEDVSKAWR